MVNITAAKVGNEQGIFGSHDSNRWVDSILAVLDEVHKIPTCEMVIPDGEKGLNAASTNRNASEASDMASGISNPTERQQLRSGSSVSGPSGNSHRVVPLTTAKLNCNEPTLGNGSAGAAAGLRIEIVPEDVSPRTK